MEQLGILRNQRIEMDTNIEGNIAQISVLLERKMEEIYELEDEGKRDLIIDDLLKKFSGVDKEEVENTIKEIALTKEKEIRPTTNVIPEAELRKAIKELEKA